MAVIAITGRKGGIGKSTITANLTAELVALGRSVAVLDTDPQRSLVAWAELGEGLLRELVEAVDTTHPRQFGTKVGGGLQAGRESAHRHPAGLRGPGPTRGSASRFGAPPGWAVPAGYHGCAGTLWR